MKKIFFILLTAIFFKTEIRAQVSMPKMMGILMIGDNNSKVILNYYIVDSAKKTEYKFDQFDVHDVVRYSDKNTLNDIYTVFSNLKQFDSLPKYDHSFGTFLFYFELQNGKHIYLTANRILSAVFFEEIICKLSFQNGNEDIIKQINVELNRIVY
jgi:hypothetical protein